MRCSYHTRLPSVVNRTISEETFERNAFFGERDAPSSFSSIYDAWGQSPASKETIRILKMMKTTLELNLAGSAAREEQATDNFENEHPGVPGDPTTNVPAVFTTIAAFSFLQ